MTNDEQLREQVGRIQKRAHDLAAAGGDPDCVIVWSGTPLGQLTNVRVSIATGELEVIPDTCCPPGCEYVGLKAELGLSAPKPSRPPAPSHEERARALCDEHRLPVSLGWALAAAFAEVERETRVDCATRFAKEQCAPLEAQMRAAVDKAVIPRATTKITASFQCFRCSKEFGTDIDAFTRHMVEHDEKAWLARLDLPGSLAVMVMVKAQDYRHALISKALAPALIPCAAKACTCGAVKTGTGPCSSWCDSK